MSTVQSGLLLTLCMPFVVATWIALMHRRRGMGSEVVPCPASIGLGGAFHAASLDLEAAVLEAATSITPLARAHSVRFDVAVSPAMRVHADPTVLGTALRDAMKTAIRATPGGQVLVTAANLGNQMHIRIVDDGEGKDQWPRESLIRDAGTLIALQGGSVAVHATLGRGTTVTIRLPMLGGEREEVGVEEFAEQAA